MSFVSFYVLYKVTFFKLTADIDAFDRYAQNGSNIRFNLFSVIYIASCKIKV